MIARPFLEPHPSDPDDAPEPRPERDPDAIRDDAIERERQHRADVRAALLYSRCHIEHLHDPRG